MTIYGKAVFKCPKTGKEAVLHEDCVNCPNFGHWGTVGSKPFITCKEEKNS
jgi:hypothetical protein